MRLPRKQLEASIPSAAMGDIAFLLLIFFVILARAQDDSHLRWDPAQAEELQQAPRAIASVVIDKDAKIFLNGRETDAAALPDQLSGLLGDNPAGRRAVLFKIDKATPAERFEPAIEAVSAAGGEVVHILDPEESG